MVRRISPSQARNQIRQAQQKQRQAVNKINQAVNKYNHAVRQRNQSVRTAVNNYNTAARAHNARVRANRQRIQNELTRLARHNASETSQFSSYRASVEALHQSHTRLDGSIIANQGDGRYNRVLDLSERETANSLVVTNRLLGDADAGSTPAEELENAQLLDGLSRISEDLDKRWQGALFSLNPNNPDAARHFCTSAREIISRILDIKAPDELVCSVLPDCQKTENGTPTRRSKIRYFLYQQGITEDTLEEFVERDMDNIVQLFRVFNDGTHGSAGTFDLAQLDAIRTRVEDGLLFLIEIIADA